MPATGSRDNITITKITNSTDYKQVVYLYFPVTNHLQLHGISFHLAIHNLGCLHKSVHELGVHVAASCATI